MPDWITLNCPSCGAKISVNAKSNRYVCDYCGNAHILPGMVNASPEPIPPPDGDWLTGMPELESSPVKTSILPVPDGVQVKEDGKCLRIVRRWFSWKIIPMAFFCMIWDSFLVFWYGTAFSMRAPWIMIVFPLLHLAVGIGLTYSTLAGFFNRTYLEVTPVDLAVWHDPLPWMGEVTLPIGDVKQLYSKQSIHQGRNGGTTFTYDLYAITGNGKTRKLLSGLDNPDIPLFFERRVEDWLHITNRPVAGELATR